MIFTQIVGLVFWKTDLLNFNILTMKLLLTILFSALFLNSYADDFLSGKMVVSPNETATYTINWPS